MADPNFRGRQFESAVVNHAGRLYDRAYFWYSTKQKREVDLLIPLGGQMLPFEMKLQRAPSFKAMGKEVGILYPEAFLEFLEHPPR